jgi:hypothetical protein
MDNFKKCVSLLMTMTESDIEKVLQHAETVANKAAKATPVFVWDRLTNGVTEAKITEMGVDETEYGVTLDNGRWTLYDVDNIFSNQDDAFAGAFVRGWIQ